MGRWKYKLASFLIGKELKSGREHYNTGVKLAAKEVMDFYKKHERLTKRDGINLSGKRYAELMLKIQNLLLRKSENNERK